MGEVERRRNRARLLVNKLWLGNAIVGAAPAARGMGACDYVCFSRTARPPTPPPCEAEPSLPTVITKPELVNEEAHNLTQF